MLSWLGEFLRRFVKVGVLRYGGLGRFASCIGQFVLTASLRAQVNPENSSQFKDVSPERLVPSCLTCGPSNGTPTVHSQISHWAR